MCTVSVVPVGDGFRLMCNRDELTTRPLARPPRRTTIHGVGAMFPVDPESGGTWVAANDAGLVLALLNRVSRCRKPRIRAEARHVHDDRPVVRTRGEIVPRLIGCRDLTHVGETLHALNLGVYKPFCLVAVHWHEMLTATGDGPRLRVATACLNRAFAFTSSSLGDADAERLRLPLFQTLVVRARNPLSGQRRFHDHQWPACPAFSVRMRRADARTVSQTIVNVQGGVASLRYEPLPIDG
jgi:hypothetical protein